MISFKNNTYSVLLFHFAVVLNACQAKKKDHLQPGSLYESPKAIMANTDGGYDVNVVTGDTIQSLINSFGDTVSTGVSIEIFGSRIPPDSILRPKSIVVPSLSGVTVNNAHPNRYKIPKDLTVNKIVQSSLKVIQVEDIDINDRTHFILGTEGDTIKTGVAIPIVGKKVEVVQPEPIKALTPRFKDAANTNIQYLDVDQGMASSKIMALLEDKRGDIWIGTDGGGVSKYNGGHFSHYTTKEGLSSNSVWSIFEDRSGNLWFGTYGGGVCKYDGEYFTHFTENEGLTNNGVRSILEDKNGNIWFATWGGGVSKFNGESCTHFTKKEGLSNDFVYSMIEDENGDLWIGTYNGVCKFDGESFTHFTEKDGLSNNIVRTLLEDKNGNLWIGTKSGVNKFDGKSFTHYTSNQGLSDNVMWSMHEDENENLWFATNGGLCKLSLGSSESDDEMFFTCFTEKEGLSSDVVLSIIEDESGRLWLGTGNGGVAMYDGSSFSHFAKNEGLQNYFVYSIFEDKKGDLWFGSKDGVSKYDGVNLVHFTEKEGLGNNYVRSIIEDKNGYLWFGTGDAGVSRFDGQSFTIFTKKEGLISNSVYSMLEDRSGDIWFGTYTGICKYDGESFTHFGETQNGSNDLVYSIQEDGAGNLWFATDGSGVIKYDGKFFTYITEKEGLLNNVVYSIYEDASGDIWFGTDGGLSIYDGESFVHFTDNEGLSCNVVYSIIEDNSGGIWLSSEKGLNQFVQQSSHLNSGSTFEKTHSKHSFTINSFEKNDGLKGMNFFYNSALFDSQNRAWWGSGKGLTMLDMTDNELETEPPLVCLKQLNINQQFIDFRNIPDSLKNEIEFNKTPQFENYPLNLKLSHNQNHLTFHYVAIDWAAPHKIKYSYRLKGVNDNWSQPSTDTKAEYRNLSHGTYVFEVKAIGESQEWSDSFEYEFIINPPWWHTWWARSLYVLVGLLLVFGFVKLRTAKLKKRQKELENEVEVAVLEIREQKEEVEKQKEHIEEVHKEITDSINYAERIQRSFLATNEILDSNLEDYFVFFQPKEAVSGDFYWAGELSDGNFAVVNADSTGHGVPGAIMSILNITSIEKSVENRKSSPAVIFNDARKTIIERLKKDGSTQGGKDGMDASLIAFNKEKTKMTYVAAQNPIWIVRNNELIEIKGEKMPVGKHDHDHIPFKGGEFDLQKGDIVYTLTDGYQDQFGGEKGKKFKLKPFKRLILENNHLSMQEQYKVFEKAFNNWKGELEQVDDICLIGIRV